MHPINPADIQLTIIDSRYVHRFEDSLGHALYEKAYVLWKDFWTEVYLSQGAEYKPSPDDFWRQDHVAILHHREKIIAMHLYSFFDFRFAVDKQHHYMDFFDAETVAGLQKRHINRVMTMEYFTVAEEFRKTKVGVPYALILGRCGIRFMKESCAQAIIAPARKDNKVDKMSYSVGFKPLKENVILRGFPCDLIVFEKQFTTISATEDVQLLVDNYWRNRTLVDMQSAINNFQSEVA